jgi:hypothetical protein
MPSEAILLLSNATATGTGKAAGPGDYCFAVDGTFSSTTVALEMQSPDGSSWLAIEDASFTAEGAVIVTLPRTVVRASVTSGTPSGLYATLSPVA